MTHTLVATATEVDTITLSTIVARAFHKNNVYFRTTFPDTPLMRTWWSAIFLDALQDPSYHVLTVVNVSDSNKLGVLLLHRMLPGAADASVFSRHQPTADHDSARFAAMLEADKSPDGKPAGSQAHFAIELLGVDSEYHGTGLGKMLLEKACGIANAESLDIHVQANVNAKAFYEKRGFVCVREVVLPGPEMYGEAFLIYRTDKSF